jgi:hypothetical protein
MPLKRLFTFLLTLPCLALTANEVGLESTNPSRFGAKFTEAGGKVAAEFNGDHGVFAFVSFAEKGEWTAEAQVTMPAGKAATLTGKIAGKAFTTAGKVEGTGKAEWISLGAFAALADAPAFLQLEAKERKGAIILHGYRFTCTANAKAKQLRCRSSTKRPPTPNRRKSPSATAAASVRPPSKKPAAGC